MNKSKITIERVTTVTGNVTRTVETITTEGTQFSKEDVERMRRDAARPSGSFFDDFFKRSWFS